MFVIHTCFPKFLTGSCLDTRVLYPPSNDQFNREQVAFFSNICLFPQPTLTFSRPNTLEPHMFSTCIDGAISLFVSLRKQARIWASVFNCARSRYLPDFASSFAILPPQPSQRSKDTVGHRSFLRKRLSRSSGPGSFYFLFTAHHERVIHVRHQ